MAARLTSEEVIARFNDARGPTSKDHGVAYPPALLLLVGKPAIRQWIKKLLPGLIALSCGPLAASGQNTPPADGPPPTAATQQATLAAQQKALADQQVAQQAALATRQAAISAQQAAETARCLRNIRVLQVRNPSSTDSTHFRLNDEVVLDVQNLAVALRKRPVKDLRLYVDDIALPMPPVAVDTLRNCTVATVRFQLVRNATTEPIWQLFYKVPGRYEHPSTFNVGFDTGQLGKAYPGGPDRLHLELVQVPWLLVGLGLLGLLGGAFYWLLRNSNFIRSDLSRRIPLDPAGLASVFSQGYRQVPYSLAKTQVAYWTLLIVAAYLMISMVTAALPTIPTGLLGLLGISIANGLFSSIISRPAADAPAVAAKGEVPNATLSRGWFQDVLTDSTGVSVVRLQFVVFNAIAGLYLVRQVLATWALPDFDSSLLALISISSAGFLVQKTNEANAATASQQDGSAGATGPAAGGTAPISTGGGPAPANPGAPVKPAAPTPPAAPGQEPPTAPRTPTGPAASPDALPADATPGLTFSALSPAAPASDPTATPWQDWNNKLAEFRAAPPLYDSDPSRRIFNPLPSSTANGCQLQVGIAATLMGGLDLVATVTSTDDRPTPLTGQVVLLLHPTYRQRVVVVPIVRGQASYQFFSAGCYTLIAMLDDGATLLAFDLANVPGAPSSFLDS